MRVTKAGPNVPQPYGHRDAREVRQPTRRQTSVVSFSL